MHSTAPEITPGVVAEQQPAERGDHCDPHEVSFTAPDTRGDSPTYSCQITDMRALPNPQGANALPRRGIPHGRTAADVLFPLRQIGQLQPAKSTN